MYEQLLYLEKKDIVCKYYFFKNPPYLWERGRGELKNEVRSNNMLVIWIFETAGVEKNEIKTRFKTSPHSFLVTIPSASPFLIIFEMAFS